MYYCGNDGRTRRSKQRQQDVKKRRKNRRKSPNKWPVCTDEKKKHRRLSRTQNNLYSTPYIGPPGRLAPRRPVRDF